MQHLHEIASFVAESPAGSIPEAAIERAKLALVDFVGVAIAGSVEPVSQIVTSHVARRARGQATVIGAAFRTDAADAALANATMGHALDFDDSSFVLGGHPTVTMMPALLAIGQERGRSGRDILEAYVVGFEVMMKLARAVNFEHYEKGWHPTATLGTLATASAVARLMRLPAGVVANALGLAASMASGIKANFGSMAKPFQVGQASRKGLTCAQLAADGLTASSAALEGPQGFFAVYNGVGQYRPGELAFRGDTLEILRSGLMFKKYPCCGATHAPIDAALDLVRAQPLRRDEIESITIAINKRRLPHVDRPIVTNGLEGKFSVQYSVAAALADREISVRHFTRAAVARPDLRDMTSRVVAIGVDRGESLSQACELIVTLKGGGTRSVRREDADGRAADDYPGYMAAKFTDCVEQVFDRAYAEALLRQLVAFDRCVGAGAVIGGLSGGRAALPEDRQ
ncbi:MAG: MmgE/PrpD family protein [Betaproteobacteria bacterium]|nr:MmgE/PrpD family protein [Betaproteobacteria bacterium]